MATWERIWELANETLSVTFLPAAVLLGLWIFRVPLSRFIGRVREASVLGAKVLAEVTDESNQRLQEIAQESSSAGDDDGGYSFDQETVEGFIAAAGRAGYELGYARVYDEHSAYPLVYWGDDGSPVIGGWKPEPTEFERDLVRAADHRLPAGERQSAFRDALSKLRSRPLS